MKIILLKTINKIGKEGDVKEVSDGYARNFLIPRGLAQYATEESVSNARNKKKLQKEKEMKEINIAAKTMKKIHKRRFNILVGADINGTLYAGIDQNGIVKELQKEGFKLTPKEIELRKKLKKIGEYNIKLNSKGKSAEIIINIVKSS